MPLGFLEPVAGLCLMTLILVDIFLTVLYVRAGSGVVAPHVGRLFWRLIRRISSGETSSSFITAMFAWQQRIDCGLGRIRTLHGDVPTLVLLTALGGTAVTSLGLTCLMKVHGTASSQYRRIDTWSGRTGDAVELLVRVFPDGQTSAGYDVMVQRASANDEREGDAPSATE